MIHNYLQTFADHKSNRTDDNHTFDLLKDHQMKIIDLLLGKCLKGFVSLYRPPNIEGANYLISWFLFTKQTQIEVNWESYSRVSYSSHEWP